MLTLKQDTMLGNIPDDWDVKPLRALLKSNNPGDWGDDRGPHMFKVLRSTNLTNERRLDLSDIAERALKPEKAEKLAPRKGDILLERSGGGPDQPVGRVGYVSKDLPSHAFSNFLHLLRPDDSEINPSFLSWLLFHINRTGRILRLEQQTTQMRNLNFRDYLTMPLPVPPSDEQAAIARVLDAVDVTIERTRDTLSRTRNAECVLIEDAFDRIDSKKRRLGDFATDVRYGTSQASSDRGWGNPVLRIPNVVGDQLALDDLAYVELRPADVKRLALNDGDLLLVRTNGNPNYVGRSAVFRAPDTKTWVYASYLIRVRLTDEILPEYVNIFLGSERGRKELLRRVTTSAGNHNINSNSIKLLSIPVPRDPSVQEELFRLVEASRQITALLLNKLRALEQLKRSLMHDLLTGTVRIAPKLIKELSES